MEPELNISVGFDAGWMPSVDPCDKRERGKERIIIIIVPTDYSVRLA